MHPPPRAGAGRRRFSRSGGNELVVVAMDPVAETPLDGRTVGARDGDRSHDLADATLSTEQEVARRHPAPDARLVRVELERPGIDRGRLGPRCGHLGRDDVEEVDPPRRTGDDLEAAVTSPGDVLLDDGRDPDPHDLHRPGW